MARPRKRKYKTLTVSEWAYNAIQNWAQAADRSMPKEVDVLIKESNRTLPIKLL